MADLEKIKKFLFDPYKIILISLVTLVLANFQIQGGGGVLINVAIVVLSSVIFDTLAAYIRLKRFLISETAVISGLIISLVMVPQAPLHILILVPALAQISKHVIRYKNRPVFNPGTLSMLLVFTTLNFPGNGWWGNINVALAVILGLIISYKIMRLYASVSFLFALVLINLFLSILSGNIIDPNTAISLALGQVFLAFFMIVEPKTSPREKYPAQVIYGFLVAIFFILLFNLSVPYAEFYALLLGNIFTVIYPEITLKLSKQNQKKPEM